MNLGTILMLAVILLSAAELFFTGRGLVRKGEGDFIIAKRIYYVSAALLFVTVCHLLLLFLFDDFRYEYVFSNSSVHLPLVYKITALWAGQEGSFLVWALILAFVGIAVMRADAENAPMLMPCVIVTKILILVSLLVKSPFDFIWRVSPAMAGTLPVDGAGMNPLLQDPWMITHPPLLYLGYALSVVPFGYALVSLLKNNLSLITERAYPWVLASFTSLGLGIFMGGYWAYRVLGWGGYWGWDPVENSSLIPWLLVTALLHGILVQKRSLSLMKTNVVLSFLFFISVFLSFFLTRSGVLADFSVHSFGDYGLSLYLASYIVFFTAVSFFFFLVKSRRIAAAPLPPGPWNRLAFTASGILLMALFACFVLFGTLMPLLSGLFLRQQIAADSGFYNSVSMIVGPAILVAILCATMPLAHVKRFSTIVMALLSVALGALIIYRPPVQYGLAAVTIPGVFLVLQSLAAVLTNRSLAMLPSRLAHIGIALFMIGSVVTHLHSSSGQGRCIQGRETAVNGIPVTFLGLRGSTDSRLEFMVRRGESSEQIAMKYYFNERMNSIYREPQILGGIIDDIYIYPDDYRSGLEMATVGRVEKGKEALVGGVRIFFAGFDTAHMTSEAPTIRANLIVNGRRLSPALYLKRTSKSHSPVPIPGTERAVSLLDIDVSSRSIWVHISPDATVTIPPDSVIVNVTKKRLIWLVWLGTVLIACGGLMAFARSVQE
ncbi:MAG: cytochrome c biogenesis protein CcsA [Spirochaetes bacterium]|nr:cytochrome c biogenesis protein CcsA [Spirochaetota bacterium]